MHIFGYFGTLDGNAKMCINSRKKNSDKKTDYDENTFIKCVLKRLSKRLSLKWFAIIT